VRRRRKRGAAAVGGTRPEAWGVSRQKKCGEDGAELGGGLSAEKRSKGPNHSRPNQPPRRRAQHSA